MTGVAADSLKSVSDELLAQGYRLKIFDAYRPQRAVDHFVRWSKDVSDTLTKAYFYPELAKDRLFPEGFICARSSHTHGSTVDLTLFDMNSGKEVDMGGTSHCRTNLIRILSLIFRWRGSRLSDKYLVPINVRNRRIAQPQSPSYSSKPHTRQQTQQPKQSWRRGYI